MGRQPIAASAFPNSAFLFNGAVIKALQSKKQLESYTLNKFRIFSNDILQEVYYIPLMKTYCLAKIVSLSARWHV